MNELNQTPEELLKQMMVPATYHHCRFDTFDPSGLKDKFDQIVESANNRQWIVIVGRETGIGKTHLAVAAMARSWAKDLTYRGIRHSTHDYRYHSALRLGMDMDMAGINLPYVFNGVLSGARCLLIDELGREPDKASDKMSYLIDDCFSRERQFIATSNLSLAEFTKRYDSATLRRITDMGIIVTADWKPKQGRGL